MSRLVTARSSLLAVACLLLSWSASAATAADAPATNPATKPVPKLVVTKAWYGDLPDGPKTDVTEKVAAMVKDGRLSVAATNDNFGDPAENTPKKLRVVYSVDGVDNVKMVDENQTLTISTRPSRIVIKSASYGDLPGGAKTDVTRQVADLVDGDTLSVAASNELFGDPADGVVKKLTVVYAFAGGPDKTKTVEENETLTISDKGE